MPVDAFGEVDKFVIHVSIFTPASDIAFYRPRSVRL